MGSGIVRSHLSIDRCVTVTMPDTGFIFFIFLIFKSLFLFLAQLCPATVSCDMKYVYISIIIFESPHEWWFKLDKTCTMIWILKPNPSL
jgi:hypothetical protein